MRRLSFLTIILIVIISLIPFPVQAGTQYISSDQAFTTATVPANVIVISGFRFAPSVVNISPGTTVTWVNQDSVSHTITSNEGLWDSGEVRPGMTFSITFISPGNFGYFCKFHPQMRGLVTSGAPALLTTAPLTATPFYNCPAVPTAVPATTYPTHLNYYSYY